MSELRASLLLVLLALPLSAERKKRLDELTDHFKKASAVLNRG
jgi:hypothetical protein